MGNLVGLRLMRGGIGGLLTSKKLLAGSCWLPPAHCGGSVRVRERNWALLLRLHARRGAGLKVNVIRNRRPIKSATHTIGEIWLTSLEEGRSVDNRDGGDKVTRQ